MRERLQLETRSAKVRGAPPAARGAAGGPRLTASRRRSRSTTPRRSWGTRRSRRSATGRGRRRRRSTRRCARRSRTPWYCGTSVTRCAPSSTRSRSGAVRDPAPPHDPPHPMMPHEWLIKLSHPTAFRRSGLQAVLRREQLEEQPGDRPHPQVDEPLARGDWPYGDIVGAALRGGEAGIEMVTGGGESGMSERSWADR